MDKKLDVLFWAALKPIKSGTFEDYVLRLAAACNENGQTIKFVLRSPIDHEVEARFKHAGLDYELLERDEHTNGRILSSYLRKFKPRTLHLHFYGAGSPLVAWARFTSSVKILLHDHNSRPVNLTSVVNDQGEATSFLQFLKRSLYGFFINQIIVVSKFLERQIHEEMYIPSGKVHVIYNGVDTSRFRPATNEEKKQRAVSEILDVLDDKPVVTFVGVLSDDKGVDVLLETIRKLIGEGIKAHYIIVGDGPMRAPVEEAVESLGREQVSYLGLRNDVDRILRASDVFVAPHKWEEAFGLTLIEAAASGLPIIASDVGAITEVIGKDEGGIRIKPDDVDSLSEAIRHLIEDEALRNKLGGLARQRAKKLYSLDAMVSETMGLYKH